MSKWIEIKKDSLIPLDLDNEDKYQIKSLDEEDVYEIKCSDRGLNYNGLINFIFNQIDHDYKVYYRRTQKQITIEEALTNWFLYGCIWRKVYEYDPKSGHQTFFANGFGWVSIGQLSELKMSKEPWNEDI